MNKKVKVVIGANYGDEGKGLMTDYFCNEAHEDGVRCLTVFCNGGAQRGHTVDTSMKHHVFKHFSSGTFALSDLYCSDTFMVNPMEFIREFRELYSLQGKDMRVFLNPMCMVTTPFDMIRNQLVERSRGASRHGSCGMGIWETLQRYAREEHPRVCDYFSMTNAKKREYLESLRESMLCWMDTIDVPMDDLRPIVESDGLISHFIEDSNYMMQIIQFATDGIVNEYPYIVFEMGQGLMLDSAYSNDLVHATPSHTGMEEPYRILSSSMKHLDKVDIETVYVSRTYVTRHGNGSLDNECESWQIKRSMKDDTNVHNPFQGSLRYARFNKELVVSMIARIHRDTERFNLGQNVSMAVTHLNEAPMMLEESDRKKFHNIYVSGTRTRDGVRTA